MIIFIEFVWNSNPLLLQGSWMQQRSIWPPHLLQMLGFSSRPNRSFKGIGSCSHQVKVHHGHVSFCLWTKLRLQSSWRNQSCCIDKCMIQDILRGSLYSVALSLFSIICCSYVRVRFIESWLLVVTEVRDWRSFRGILVKLDEFARDQIRGERLWGRWFTKTYGEARRL